MTRSDIRDILIYTDGNIKTLNAGYMAARITLAIHEYTNEFNRGQCEYTHLRTFVR